LLNCISSCFRDIGLSLRVLGTPLTSLTKWF